MTTTEHRSLQNLLRLQSTASVEAKVEELILARSLEQPEPERFNVAYYEGLLLRCQERDVIKASRPERCTCLGLGRRDCPCPEGVAANAQHQNELRRQSEFQMRQGRTQRWDDAGIPRRFRAFRLTDSPVLQTQPDLVAALSPPNWTLEDFSQELERWDRSWFLWGDHSRGKTSLAVGYAWGKLQEDTDEFDRPLVIRFFTVPGLLSQIRATMNEGSDLTEEALMKRCSEAHVLILDDLGAEKVSGWVEERLYLIIGQRHDEMSTTVFTSNLSLEQLEKRLGQRIAWRIMEMCGADNILELRGPNLRDRHG